MDRMKEALRYVFEQFEGSLKGVGGYEDYLDELGVVSDLLGWFDQLTYAEAFELMDINKVFSASFTLRTMHSVFNHAEVVSMWIDVVI